MSARPTIINDHEGVPIHAWIEGVEIEAEALQQLKNVANLPILGGHVAAMPDVHFGIGATVGSVIPTINAIIPAAVGVDIGCGMMAVRTSLNSGQLPDSLKNLRSSLERAVPHGRKPGKRDPGSWTNPPEASIAAWNAMEPAFSNIIQKHPAIREGRTIQHLGTLGTGNHFIEICLDEAECVWVMLHSGSRGIGNRIGTYFIELAKRDMEKHLQHLPDVDLAYFREGNAHFNDYVEAVEWAQEFAALNRELMMENILKTMRDDPSLPPFEARLTTVNCHHNYVRRERHFGREMYITRKGAVRAGAGEAGIIPGSMGARSFIVRGLGNPYSYESCSHGAGRAMSRKEARRRFTVAEHEEATKGVECRKDEGVIDETPMAYKNIDRVMAAQRDLVDITHTLRQIVCIKG
ncbi:MAG: RtcB family protein [Planctomycetes bacterium]|nr:RtcB family protein [Planctomycetota bacterium]